MDHVVYVDVKERELEKLLTGEKTMIVRGATLASVSSYPDGAHALFDSMGSTEVDLREPWIKEW